MKKIYLMIIFILAVSILFLEIDMVKKGAVAQQSDVVVVVNKNAPSLSRSQIRNIFTGRVTRWPEGGPIRVLINKDVGIYRSFCRKYIHMSYRTVDNLWVRKAIRDGIAIPRKVPGSVIRMFCSNSERFIGFIPRSEVTGDLKVIE